MKGGTEKMEIKSIKPKTDINWEIFLNNTHEDFDEITFDVFLRIDEDYAYISTFFQYREALEFVINAKKSKIFNNCKNVQL